MLQISVWRADCKGGSVPFLCPLGKGTKESGTGEALTNWPAPAPEPIELRSACHRQATYFDSLRSATPSPGPPSGRTWERLLKVSGCYSAISIRFPAMRRGIRKGAHLLLAPCVGFFWYFSCRNKKSTLSHQQYDKHHFTGHVSGFSATRSEISPQLWKNIITFFIFSAKKY